ncbi:hypothetical protein BDW42DRAFT_158799 [Aspergillus taichungensis]|uniref:Uncharacterized protein n=1 Tax=Aspergillus taichungensis TaxID=482145 RepID=A0A2J5I882_9EURO|nr:hypothetical protein BDW42DRAFT_158799 [Aspergillus taichungensis]
MWFIYLILFFFVPGGVQEAAPVRLSGIDPVRVNCQTSGWIPTSPRDHTQKGMDCLESGSLQESTQFAYGWRSPNDPAWIIEMDDACIRRVGVGYGSTPDRSLVDTPTMVLLF